MNDIRTYTDQKLVKLLSRHGLEAFEEIYARYLKRLYSAAYKRVHSREVAEELVQDVFASLWTNRKTQRIEDLSAYLFTAVKYKVINHIQRELSRKAYLQDQTQSPLQVVNATENAVLWDDLNEALEREIQKLPEKRQLIFKLSRQENLSVPQVASNLGISEKTVENQLGKAIKTLKVNLRHYNIFLLSGIAHGLALL